MKRAVLYHAESGAILAACVAAPTDADLQRIAAGIDAQAALLALADDASAPDALSQRVQDGAIVDWQPPQPEADEYTDYVWNADVRRWLAVETVPGRRRRLADRVNAIRSEALRARRVTPAGIAYRIVNDRANLETVLTGRAALGVPPEATTDWRDDDNVMHALDGAALAALVGHMLPVGQAIYDRSWALKDVIDAAATLDALGAIDLSAGWPM